MCGVYHGCAVIRVPQKKNGRHLVIGSPSRPRAPKISRMTSLAAHAPFIGCTCALHGAIILTILLPDFRIFHKSVSVQRVLFLCLRFKLPFLRLPRDLLLRKRISKRENTSKSGILEMFPW